MSIGPARTGEPFADERRCWHSLQPHLPADLRLATSSATNRSTAGRRSEGPTSAPGSATTSAVGGAVYAFSGRTRALLRTINHPDPQERAQFGFWSTSLGDVNGDRVNDLAVSAPSQDVDGVADQGLVYVISGSNGEALYTLKDPDRQESFTDFGGNIVSPGDLNGDGIGDLAVTASAHDRGALRRAGGGYAFSGKDGALLYRVQDPEPQNQARLGFGIAAPGDVNNDGVGDIYFGVPFFDEGTLSDVGRGVVFNGRTGAPLLVIRHPDPHAGARFGQVDAQPGAPGDVNRDGFRDVYVNGFIQNVGQLVGPGRGYVFSGRDASLLLRLDDPTPVHGGQFGNAVAPGGDLDKDRRADLLVGENPHHVSDAENIGGAHVFGRGLTRPLISFEHPAPQRDSIFGAALAAPGDVNGDGEPDYWIAAPSMDVGGNQNQGRVFVFRS